MLKQGEVPHFSVKSNGYIGMKVEDVDTSSRKVKWVGNTYGFLDSEQEVIMMGACKKSILERGPDSSSVAKIKHALDHDLTRLPGKIIELSEGTVNIKGQNLQCLTGVTQMTDTTLGNETLVNYLEGVYDNHSIGFKYLQYKFLERKHGNSKEGDEFNRLYDTIINQEDAKDLDLILRVDDIKLYENSTVAFGANSLT